MITTGSTRGKCSVAQAGHLRPQPARNVAVASPPKQTQVFSTPEGDKEYVLERAIVAAEQAVRHFPMHARVSAPEESKYKQPHAFDRDRLRAGFFCKCGEEANTAIHGRG